MIIKYRGDDRPKGSKTNDRCRAAPPRGTREPLLPGGCPKRQRTRARGRRRVCMADDASEEGALRPFPPSRRLRWLPGLLASSSDAGEPGGGLFVRLARPLAAAAAYGRFLDEVVSSWAFDV